LLGGVGEVEIMQMLRRKLGLGLGKELTGGAGVSAGKKKKRK
jgi:hypothetical protein